MTVILDNENIQEINLTIFEYDEMLFNLLRAGQKIYVF